MNDIKFTTSECNILISTCYGHFITHFNMLIFPAIVLPLSNQFNISLANTLDLSFFMYLFFGITAIFWGIAADRYKATPFLILLYVGAGLSGMAAYLNINSTTGFSISLAFIGIFSGIYHPVGLGLISKEVNRVSIGMGYNGMFGILGLALAPVIGGFINFLTSPGMVYLFLGILNFIGIILMMLFPMKETSKDIIKNSSENKKKVSTFLILLFALMIVGIIYRGATVIIPTYFELNTQDLFLKISTIVQKNISKNLVATIATSIIFFIGMIAQFVGGKMAEKYNPEYCFLVFYLITIPAAFLMAILTDASLILMTIVFFFFSLGTQPSENTLIANLSPKKFHHAAYGLKFILTFGVGSLSVKMIGFIESRFGIKWIFSSIGLLNIFLISSILILIYSLYEKKTATD